MILLHFLIPLIKLISMPWKVIGLIPVIIGILLNLIADSAFRRAGTTVKPSMESTALITDGIFRLSRHPMYLGFLLILVGSAILLGTLSPWVIIPIFVVLIQVQFISVEERMLADKFGPTWLDYKRKVRRWI
jgi:protein-S-isoprenylcysteine O-methyltransferase Ste14